MSISYKRVHFEGFVNGRPHTDAVSYVPYPGQQIVFTILRNGGRKPLLSTSTCIESIIAAIAKEEGVDPKELTFYELATHIGSHFNPGQYSFSRITIEWNGTGIADAQWQAGLCSEAVIAAFSGYIMKDGDQGKPRNFFMGSRTLPCPAQSRTYTIQDLYDIGVLIGQMRKKTSLAGLCDTAMQRLTDEVIRTFCREMSTADEDFEKLMALPRDTNLGKATTLSPQSGDYGLKPKKIHTARFSQESRSFSLYYPYSILALVINSQHKTSKVFLSKNFIDATRASSCAIHNNTT